MYTFDQIVASAYFVFADLIIKDKNQNIGLSRTIICAYLEKYKIEKGLEFKNGKFALDNLAGIISFDGTMYKMNDNYTSKDLIPYVEPKLVLEFIKIFLEKDAYYRNRCSNQDLEDNKILVKKKTGI